MLIHWFHVGFFNESEDCISDEDGECSLDNEEEGMGVIHAVRNSHFELWVEGAYGMTEKSLSPNTLAFEGATQQKIICICRNNNIR